MYCWGCGFCVWIVARRNLYMHVRKRMPTRMSTLDQCRSITLLNVGACQTHAAGRNTPHIYSAPWEALKCPPYLHSLRPTMMMHICCCQGLAAIAVTATLPPPVLDQP